jgi:hypothetical protein
VNDGFSRHSDSVIRDANLIHSVNKVRINEPKVPKEDFADNGWVWDYDRASERYSDSVLRDGNVPHTVSKVRI